MLLCAVMSNTRSPDRTCSSIAVKRRFWGVSYFRGRVRAGHAAALAPKYRGIFSRVSSLIRLCRMVKKRNVASFSKKWASSSWKPTRPWQQHVTCLQQKCKHHRVSASFFKLDRVTWVKIAETDEGNCGEKRNCGFNTAVG